MRRKDFRIALARSLLSLVRPTLRTAAGKMTLSLAAFRVLPREGKRRKGEAADKGGFSV